MDESPSDPVRPKMPTVAETTYLVGMAGIGRGRSPSHSDVTSPSTTARGRGTYRGAHQLYCGEPLPDDDFGPPTELSSSGLERHTQPSHPQATVGKPYLRRPPWDGFSS